MPRFSLSVAFAALASITALAVPPADDPEIKAIVEAIGKKFTAHRLALESYQKQFDELKTKDDGKDKARTQQIAKLGQDIQGLEKIATDAAAELKSIQGAMKQQDAEVAGLKASLKRLSDTWASERAEKATPGSPKATPEDKLEDVKKRIVTLSKQTTVMGTTWQNKFPRQAKGRLLATSGGKSSPLVGHPVNVYRQVLDQDRKQWVKVDALTTDEGGVAVFNIPDTFKSWPKDTYLVFDFAGDDEYRPSSDRVKVR